MSRRVRLVLGCAVFAVLAAAAPATAEDCLEVGQFKHCLTA